MSLCLPLGVGIIASAPLQCTVGDSRRRFARREIRACQSARDIAALRLYHSLSIVPATTYCLVSYVRQVNI